MKSADSWQKKMYDEYFAQSTLGSKKFVKLAKKETRSLKSLLGLEAGDRVLDVPCGAGRHSSALADLGMEVTGLDISSACLRLARIACKDRAVALKSADMSQLARYRGEFDAVVNLFSSFGYFSSDQKNERVLKELVSTLKPGGKIAIHLINRDWLLKVFKAVEWREEKEKTLIEVRKYDPKTRYIESKLIAIDRKSGKSKTYPVHMRLYSKTEMVRMMRGCGLKDIQVFGDFEGGKFSKLGSSHPVYMGKKPFHS
jgi:SAM-dependent methyltransferase